MRLATWRPVKPLPHAAFAAFERDDLSTRMYLTWDCENGWTLSIRIEVDGRPAREVNKVFLAGPDQPQPDIGDTMFALADAIAEQATR